MSDANNPIYELVATHRLISAYGELTLIMALKKTFNVEHSSTALSFLLAEFSGAIECLLTVERIPEARLNRHVENLECLRERCMSFLAGQLVRQYLSDVAVTLDLVEAAGDMFAALPQAKRETLDREEFRKETGELIASLSNSGIHPAIANAIRLKLVAVNRLLDGSGSYSDRQIGDYVKRVYADFCADFEAMDLGDQTLRDQMLSWARAGSAVVLLGLNVSADVATLTAPAERLAIDAPAKQIEEATPDGEDRNGVSGTDEGEDRQVEP